MGIRNDQGIVLRSYPFGEADRIVVLLSPNNGKIRTVAKGIRKTKSRFGGRLETFSHVDLQLYEGRNLHTITSASLIDSHHHIRDDLDSVSAAGTMVEVVDAVSQEGESSVRMFLLLQRGLKTLDLGGFHGDIVTAFLIKAATVIGLAPAFDECASCGSEQELRRFSFSNGGVVCESCRMPGAYALRPGVVSYLSAVAAAELHKLPPVDTAFSGEALGVTRRFVEFHLERRLRTLVARDG